MTSPEPPHQGPTTLQSSWEGDGEPEALEAAHGSPLDLLCDSPCTFKGETHSCKDRVHWLVNEGASAVAALDTVSQDCSGQCSCSAADMRVEEASATVAMIVTSPEPPQQGGMSWVPGDSTCKWETSNGGRTLTLHGGNPTGKCMHAHATLPKASGRWYQEVRIDSLSPISRPGGTASVLVGFGLCAGAGWQCDGWLMYYDYDYAPGQAFISAKPVDSELIKPYP